ncbi:SCO5918 family protein [Streptomyces sp. NBC_01433]|uniref:SCO5918 family protein n=1 Tax=Streptomyces sp. NBC_01433 TaxID=2903864 RepID=UPI00225938C2|nr:SCO5918 family protein [Streptomyces sp. NBC_01433]MCX4675959.1 SCO5918 family protein [Streptomyces sp. NBC_01433]
MRCVIARFPFDLFKNEVEDSMKGIKPEPVTGDAVVISRRVYPVKQVGEVITRQDRRDFSSAEVTRALTRLGFTCRTAQAAVPAPALTPLETASALLGTPEPRPEPVLPAAEPLPAPGAGQM